MNTKSIVYIIGVCVVLGFCLLNSCNGQNVEQQKPNISDADLDTALNDRRYLMRQLKCAIGEGPCDPVGRRLKSLAPFVLRGNCPQCSETEKTQIQKTLSHLQRNFPKEWNRLLQTYTSG